MRSFPTRFATACVVAVTALAGVFAPSAHGDIIVNYQDVGSDLQFSWSGSLSALPPGNAPGGPSTIARIASPNSGSTLQDLYALGGNYDRYSYTPGRTPAGTGLFAETFSAINGTRTGDTFGISFPSSPSGTMYVFLPRFYQAGAPVVGTLTIPNASVASAGLSDVSFALGTGGNIIFQVPEPSTLALGGVAVAGLGFAGVLRRRVC